MDKEQITYTIAATDKTGKIPMVYLKPNYFDPAVALERLKELRAQNPQGKFRVFEYSGRLLDDAELQKLVDEQGKKA